MKASRVLHLGMALTVLIGAATSSAQAQTAIYPGKGQSSQQQQKDEGECHTWAVGNSGYDPTNPQKQASAPPPPTTPTGVTPGAGVRGAVAGAVVGEIVGNDARSGAAAGAVVARGASRRQNAAAAQKQQQAAVQQDQAGMGAYQKSRAACLEGRGYTVK